MHFPVEFCEIAQKQICIHFLSTCQVFYMYISCIVFDFSQENIGKNPLKSMLAINLPKR